MVRKVFTTGQVAKISNVTTQTVTKWIDSGRLTGYKIPGSRARRVTRESLIRFIEEHNIPTDYFTTSKFTVLVVGPGEGLAEDIKKALSGDARLVVESVQDQFCAGHITATSQPEMVLVNTDEASLDIGKAARLIASKKVLHKVRFVAVSSLPEGLEDESKRKEAASKIKSDFIEAGYDGVVFKPVEPTAVVRTIYRLLGLD